MAPPNPFANRMGNRGKPAAAKPMMMQAPLGAFGAPPAENPFPEAPAGSDDEAAAEGESAEPAAAAAAVNPFAPKGFGGVAAAPVNPNAPRGFGGTPPQSVNPNAPRGFGGRHGASPQGDVAAVLSVLRASSAYSASQPHATSVRT
ncbi:unnamed protein product [Polarella glacialis]|uniref:Uncharacterized protein n=1 Tax=Polarella glacialis TaxID=89957 RepID=A0A813J7S9_POLGL|nr:unnamed protein product [Polarella glacialis]